MGHWQHRGSQTTMQPCSDLIQFREIAPVNPGPYELFDIDRGPDKVFFIGTAWIVLFLFLL